MKNVHLFTALLLISPVLIYGQNYVANIPNANTPGSQNTLVGVSVGNSTLTGIGNTFLGFQSGVSSTTATFNTFLGYQTGLNTTTGGYNVFLGNRSGSLNTTGSSNLFMGSYAGEKNTTGNYNLFIGNGSGQNSATGEGNTFIGDGSGFSSTAGVQNTYIGRYAGVTGNATGSNNTFIGFGAGVPTTGTNVNNSVAIGANAQVNQNNAIVLGGTGVNSVSVGIGNTAPQNRLEITAAAANRSGLRFTNLTRASQSLVDLSITLSNPIVKVLTVDDNGDVVLAGLGVNLSALGGRLGTGLWESKGSYMQNTSEEGVIIGSGVTKTPSDYNLFVSKGILTEKVKVAVKGTEEWSDYVFDSSYKLKGLSEVADFIKTNKHLPGIPSAKEMVEQGNDLHKTDAKLLAKIEELTLYMIEMKRDNQQLRQSVNALKRQNAQMNRKLRAMHQ